VAQLSGIALSPELQDRYGWHAKNCDPVSVLRVRTSRLFGEPSSSRFPRVGSACTVLLPPLCWHLTAVQLAPYCPVPIPGTITAEWLSWPGGSPHPPHPLLRFTLLSHNLALGYAVSWYRTTSLAHAKVQFVADYWGQPVPDLPAPVALGVWG